MSRAPANGHVDFARPVVAVLGLPLDAVDEATAADTLVAAAATRRPLMLSTPNLNFAIACLDDAEFRASVLQSDLSVADGMPLVWLSRWLGAAVPGRVAGSSLFDRLCRQARHRFSVFFLGGAPGAADAACERLNRDDLPGARGVGALDPGFGDVHTMSGDAMLSTMNDSGADLLVLAIGARKGQAWLLHNREALQVPVRAYLGAVINFAAGTVRRAPRWMQRSGLEWLWRIGQERSLFSRYWQDGRRLLALTLGQVLPGAWLLCRTRPPAEAFDRARASSQTTPTQVRLSLSGAWGRANVGRLRELLADAASRTVAVSVDVSQSTYLDPHALGLLMVLAGACQRHGVPFAVVGATPRQRRYFEACCATYLLAE